ncbi:IclR family transcriptional regulator [Streptomyces sp. NBC_01618]|uniref:IclR family transcriptional regulator n=1 Tax=Streptomyces sp. NBC_01618 TaxID=2975900 RepID=UPI0038667DF7|nr:helix-turn-helix domain-containing protein [Streptomyces sp. NBC_01618]
MSGAVQLRTPTGIGVLDKAALLLQIVEEGPASLGDLVKYSGLTRQTIHRLALALERLGLLTRDPQGRFVLGPRLDSAGLQVRHDRLAGAAGPFLSELHAETGLDARLHRRLDDLQVCVAASAGSACGQVPLGMPRPASTGPVAQVLLAWAEPDAVFHGLNHARFTAAQLTLVRRRGWAYGPDRMLPGSVTYAAPVRGPDERVVAALALTGPAARMPEAPERSLTGPLFDAVAALGDAMSRLRPDVCPTVKPA